MTDWLARRRRRPGSRPGQRAGTVHAQVALVLRWLRHRLDVRALAADAGVSIATAYRSLHEALDVIAAQAPALSAAGTLCTGSPSAPSASVRLPPPHSC